ncbi:MAG TPA: FtsW/RodA/SpoVE family cell cycle protein, partial [Gemmatimonadaceae bacterium]|nr:FtsW/RodA/SpoVE family cell cycle protein [Gemmatimonadaceae bacterium]
MSRPIVADYRLLAAAGILSVFGVAMVYSAGQTDTPTAVATVYKSQILWLLIGVGFAYAVGRSSVRFIEWMTTPLYLFSVFLLGLTLVIGKGAGTAASTKSWLAIGSHRIGQPSEIAKVTVVLMLAKVLSNQRETPKSLLDLWKPALVVGIPWMIIMLQPDLGTGIVFIGIFFAMLYWAGVAWPLLILIASPAISLILSFSVGLWGAWFFVLLALVLWYRPYLIEGIVLMVLNVATGVIAPMMWEKLAPYQQNRLRTFID